MAPSTPARLTRHQGMKFAFTLGLAFAVLSALAAWRQRVLTAYVLFVVATVLLMLGLLVPTWLGSVERAWMGLGHAIGRVTSPVVLGVIYYMALTPVAILRRTFGRSPMARDAKARTYWIPRAPQDEGERRRALERQF